MFARQAAGVPSRRAGANFLRFEDIDRQQKFHAALLRKIEKFGRQVCFVRLNAAGTDRNSLGFEKRIRHRAADQNRLGLFYQRFENADLIGYFRSAHDHDERLGRVVQLFMEILQLLLH